MDEKKLWKRLEDSAKELQIPDSLKPDRIRQMLSEGQENERKQKKLQRERRALYWAAGAAVFLATAGSFYGLRESNKAADGDLAGSQIRMLQREDSALDAGSLAEAAPKQARETEEKASVYGEEKTLLIQPTDYQELAKLLQEAMDAKTDETQEMVTEGNTEAGEYTTEKQTNTDTRQLSGPQAENGSAAEGSGEPLEEMYIAGAQVLYRVYGSRIEMYETIEGEIRQSCVIDLPMMEDTDTVFALYETEGILQAVCGTGCGSEEEGVTVYTYHVEDPSAPRLLGQVSQEGVYLGSAGWEGGVYLAMQSETALSRGDGAYGRGEEDQETAEGPLWLPCFGQAQPPVSDIYVDAALGGEGAASATVAASILTAEPDRVSSLKLLYVGEAEAAVSDSRMYLFDREEGTPVLKAAVSLRQGILQVEES